MTNAPLLTLIGRLISDQCPGILGFPEEERSKASLLISIAISVSILCT